MVNETNECTRCGMEPAEIDGLCFTCEIVGSMEVISEIGEYLAAYEDVS